MTQCSNSNHNYPLLDLTQFIASLLVILIHCGHLVNNEVVHFLIKSLLCRLAVPFFFVSTGYFYRTKQKLNPHYSTYYWIRQLKSYALWSLIYLPYGWFFLSQYDIPPLLYPVALIIAFLYSGVCYHLWYFPALLTSLWLSDKVRGSMPYIFALALAFSLYFLGASETYSGYLSDTGFAPIYQSYKGVFFTTRNGLFYGFIFVLLGFIIADFKDTPLTYRHLFLKLSGSMLLLLGEGWLIYRNQGDDKNFLFGLIPLVFFIVCWIIQSPVLQGHHWQWLKPLSHSLFFVHPLVLENLKALATRYGFPNFQGIPLFSLTLIITTLLYILSRKVLTHDKT